MALHQTVSATIIVPTFDEERNVEPLVERLRNALSDRIQNGETFQVLFVDDSRGSNTIGAVRLAEVAFATDQFMVHGIHRIGTDRRGGLAGAVVHGMREALSDCIVVMDGDLQHPPERVPGMIDAVQGDRDIVVASRYTEGGSSAGLDGGYRVFVSKAATAVTRGLFPVSIKGITDPMTGFFCVDRRKLNLDRLRNVDGFKILLDILAMHPRLAKGQLPFEFGERNAGDSKADASNGIKFIKQLPLLRLRTLPTIASFLLGGGLFAVVGALLLFLMVVAGVNHWAAFAIQLVITIALNFEFNKHFTWYGHTNGRLRRKRLAFFATRGITAGASLLAFPWLVMLAEHNDPFNYGLEVHTQVANVVCVIGATLLNFVTSKFVFEDKESAGRHERAPRRKRQLLSMPLAILLVGAGVTVLIVGSYGFSGWLLLVTISFATLSLTTASLETDWRLYGRRTPEAREAMLFPEPIKAEDAQLSFTYMVAGLREAPVIGHTLMLLLEHTHPNVQIVVTLVEDDHDTIAAVREVMDNHDLYDRILLVTNTYEKGSKAAQLNYALQFCTGDYVCPVDAETKEHPELASHVEALIRKEEAHIVQCGVQLMNVDVQPHATWDGPKVFPSLRRFMQRFTPWLIAVLRPFFTSKLWAKCRSWFAVHNVLEYFFWWSSRAMRQAKEGFLPFGGNTIFIDTEVLKMAGGWPETLTEDANLGTRISARFPWVKIVAAYDPRLVAQEETPPHVWGKGGLVLQRVRWVQGFIEVLVEGEWFKLPTLRQRALAFYTLVMPLIQALNGVMLPVAVAGMIWLRAPLYLVIPMFTPFIPMLVTLFVQTLGLREFSQQQGIKVRIRHYLCLIFGSPFYQWVLAYAAMVAVKRHMAQQTHWEKTEHVGAHQGDTSGVHPGEGELVGAGR